MASDVMASCFVMPSVTTVLNMQNKRAIYWKITEMQIHFMYREQIEVGLHFEWLMGGVSVMSSTRCIFDDILLCASKELFVSNYALLAKCETVICSLLMHWNTIALHLTSEIVSTEREKLNIWMDVSIAFTCLHRCNRDASKHLCI